VEFKQSGLDRITKRHLNRLVQLAPETGAFLGLAGTPAGLPPMGEDGIRARLDLYRDWVDEVSAVPAADLTDSETLDVEVFQRHHELYRYVIGDLRRWRHNPDAISPLGELFFVLLVAQRDSDEARFEDVLLRLQAVPSYLEGVKGQLGTLDETWADIADRVCRRMAPLWGSLADEAARHASPALARDVEQASLRAASSVEAYRKWLSEERPRQPGLWILDDDQFDGLIARKHLGMTVAEIRELGLEYLAHYRELRGLLARQLGAGDDLEAARRTAGGALPADFGEALARVRELVIESRRFVAERGLATLPQREELSVLQTPDFFVPIIPFAAMLEAGVYESVQRSVYMVTPPQDGDLLGLSKPRFSGIAVHEGYPGHHLQHTLAHRACSLYRNNPFVGFPVDGAARFGLDLVEGWAHFCEEMMKDQGFHDTPQSRYWMVEDQLFRAVRILVDIDLSRGRMSPAEAAAFLCDELGMPQAGAEAEVRRYTTSPTYQLCYLLGKHKIERFRDEARTLEGEAFEDRRFHEVVLAEGSIPVEMIRARYLASREQP